MNEDNAACTPKAFPAERRSEYVLSGSSTPGASPEEALDSVPSSPLSVVSLRLEEEETVPCGHAKQGRARTDRDERRAVRRAQRSERLFQRVIAPRCLFDSTAAPPIVCESVPRNSIPRAGAGASYELMVDAHWGDTERHIVPHRSASALNMVATCDVTAPPASSRLTAEQPYYEQHVALFRARYGLLNADA